METDILIIGGGIAGSALAAYLGQSQWDIIVLDKNLINSEQPDLLTGRVCALNTASQQFLQQCGAWQLIAKQACAPMTDMHVWDNQSGARIDFDSADLGVAAMANIVNNQNLIAALWQRLNSMDNVKTQTGHRIDNIDQHKEYLQANLDNGESIQAKLIVAADGGQSWLRQHLNHSTNQKSYQQNAVVTVVQTEQPHQSAAWQNFLDNGPLGLLPLSNPKQCAVVWSTTPEQAKQLAGLSTKDFDCAINQVFSQHPLGNLQSLLPAASFPLIESHIHHYVDERIAFIGDAAHTIHPLAGQGANLGLMDALTLGNTINQARARHRDIGKKHILRPYERARRTDNQATIDLMRAFNHSFSSKNPWLQKIIKVGLPLINRTNQIKRMMMRIASGQFSSTN